MVAGTDRVGAFVAPGSVVQWVTKRVVRGCGVPYDEPVREMTNLPSGWTPETISRASKALSAWEAAYSRMIQRRKREKISAGELRQAALQTHIARGGNPDEPLTMADYQEADQALQMAAATLREMEEHQKMQQNYREHLKLIEPLLTEEERKSGKITFARAAAIITGNHDRPKDYRKPGRWIQDFLKRHREGMRRTLQEHLRSLNEVEEQLLPDVSALMECIEKTPYDDLGQTDLLTLEEFAGMHSLNWQWFRRNGPIMRRLVEGKDPEYVGKVLSLKRETIEALKKGQKSHKKVLGLPSGQPKKATPRKPKKRRTKSA